VSCAETAESIYLPFGLWTLMDRRKHEFNRIRQAAPMCKSSILFARLRQCVLTVGHIGATWRMRLNRLSAAAMQSYVSLL